MQADSTCATTSVCNRRPRARPPIMIIPTRGRDSRDLSYLIDSQTRLSLLTGAAVKVQVAAGARVDAAIRASGELQALPSTNVAESRARAELLRCVALQKWIGEGITYQLAAFSRYYALNYSPDPRLDLSRWGRGQTESGSINGMQEDTSYKLDPHHTFGAGFYFSGETIESDSHAQTFLANPDGTQKSPIPINVVNDNHQIAWLLGF